MLYSNPSFVLNIIPQLELTSMLGFLLAAQRCYTEDSVLVGVQQKRLLELTLTPENDSTCAVFDGMPSKCTLHYVVNNVQQTVTAEYTHSSTKPAVVEFDLNDGTTKFADIEKEKRVSYGTEISGSFTPAPGAVSYINHMQMDSTECWSSLVLRFDSTTGSEIIAVEVKPLDCELSSIDAIFQFWDKKANGWADITIYGQPEAGENADTVYVAGKPFSGGYTFQSVTIYRETSEQLMQMISDEENGQNNETKILAYKQSLDNIRKFIIELTDRKETQSRLYLKTSIKNETATAPAIVQDIIGDCSGQVTTYSDECFANPANYFYPNVYAQSRMLSFDFMRSTYESGVGCTTGAAYVMQVYYKIQYVNGTVFENTTEYKEAFSSDLRAAPGFNFDVNQLDLDEIVKMQHTAFLKVLDEQGEVKAVESITGDSKLACIKECHMEYGVGKACVRLTFNTSDRCKATSTDTYLGFFMHEKNLKGYECFSFDIEHRDEETTFCTKRKYKVVFGLDIGGDDQSRYDEFKKDYQMNDGNMVIGFIGGPDMIIQRNLTLERTWKNLLGFYIAVGIVLVGVIIGISILLHMMTK